jgi:uncharacterized protein (DUF2237 family)
MSNKPLDPALYARVKKAVYTKYPQHSAYRSGRLVQEYLKRGGQYKGKRKSGKLARWFQEKWTNQRGGIGYARKGDVYRPSKRVSKKTPTTWHELSPKQIKRAQREKRATGHVKRFKELPCSRVPWTHRKSQRVPGTPTTCRRKDGKVMKLPRKFSRQQCRDARGFTQRASCAAYLKGGEGEQDQQLNVAGDPLEFCNTDPSKETTGYSGNNMCTSVEEDTGKHRICFTDIATPVSNGKTLCTLSGQDDWCRQGNRGNWCICEWAAQEALNNLSTDEDRKTFLSRIKHEATNRNVNLPK